MFSQCQICGTPIEDDKMDGHLDWHEEIGIIDNYIISVFWTNDADKAYANDLRKYLRNNQVDVSEFFDDRFDIFVDETSLESVSKIVKKRLGTCTMGTTLV